MDKRRKYNWKEIQKAYDDEHLTLRQLTKKFGCCMSGMHSAIQRGDLITRTQSDAAKLSCKLVPRTHSEETKKKISNIRKEFLKNNPDKVPYKLNHYSKKTPYSETYFLEVFEKENIDLKYHLQIGIYELDFYNEEIKLCVEVDGNQHYYDKRIIESDIKRTKYLENLGWKVERIRWSEYQKKTLLERKQVIEYIKNLIEILKRDISIPGDAIGS